MDQDGNSEYFYYDEEQNQILHIDRNGNQVAREYNVDGNVVRETAVDRDNENKITSIYSYDSRGRLKQAVNDGFSYSYRYTPDGRLAEKQSGGKTLLKYRYDLNGRMKSLRDVTGKTTHYEYDGAGRLCVVKNDKLEKAASYEYYPDDRIKNIHYKNGVVTHYEYDSDGNISRLVTTHHDMQLFACDYRYDGNGNLTSRQGIMPGAPEGFREIETSYVYDQQNRLVNENRPDACTLYQYDPAGNRIRKEGPAGVQIYQYNSRNQLTDLEGSEEKLHFTYDLQGSILKTEGSEGTTQYSYNPLNQQTEVVTPEGFQKNRYDPEGLRAEMEENGSLARFAFHNKEMLLEMDASETPVARFIRGCGIEGCEQAGQTYYYHKDEHQSISLITDEAGKAENCYQYDAFGMIVQSREGIHNRITYSGQQYDGVTGQFYLRSRYYNPVLGRFLQEDTYRGDGLNLYAYCANNPVSYYDPSGHNSNNCQSDIVNGGDESEEVKHPNGIYEEASYHGKENNSVKNKAPIDGQGALDNSVPIKPETTTRRVGVSADEMVVLDETTSGIFHGHVRGWQEMSQQMKNALIRSGKVNRKGKIL